MDFMFTIILDDIIVTCSSLLLMKAGILAIQNVQYNGKNTSMLIKISSVI